MRVSKRKVNLCRIFDFCLRIVMYSANNICEIETYQQKNGNKKRKIVMLENEEWREVGNKKEIQKNEPRSRRDRSNKK